MDYQLENLGDERFQEVCQSLLVKAYPNLQCFPIGQRDGGRDAIAYIRNTGHDGFIVFQVKFVRKPNALQDAHKWLIDTVAKELPSVAKLIPKGARAYYLLTNVPGTAYPASGSIDQVHSILTSTLTLPSQCWWREDINRRLDDTWDLKWAYPEILSGADVLRYIVTNGASEATERRTNALRAFVRDQHDRDQEVRFKQVELQNKLLDLFIDVPITIRDRASRVTRRQAIETSVVHRTLRAATTSLSSENAPDDRSCGAATFLLNANIQSYVSRIVLEGAPGQGKSTLVQYICQIHRRRLLLKSLDDSRIPDAHRKAPVRIPFRVDLRDLALWLDKKNPFSSQEDDVPHPHWVRSLEAFLAAQVHESSGGIDFSVHDLHELAKVSALLVVFDGLDEVADIASRQAVVDEIVRGVSRLSEIAVSFQAVVTSRPAAFANSPGMPDDSFLYLELDSITPGLIHSYANKWLAAKGLAGREAKDVNRILRDKLAQPHLHELARNPMQLAILLSLIHRYGESLPDKRTALYRSYVELFFSREAEKSPAVREHRDVLLEIHGYLAWTLHSEAQRGNNRGRVTAERLQTLVTGYLEEKGEDVAIADALFKGMVERVVALVSRVEGTYEFEVQPLREYFAARFLYSTAPYCQSGERLPGTKPDRFDAMARDFYWLNIVRFYAGCYDVGELHSLVDRLEELSKDETYRYSSHSRTLAAMLLSDWVFTQYPKIMKRVIAMLLDGLGLRQLMGASGHRGRRNMVAVLPRKCGQDELVNRGFELLCQQPPRDFALSVIELIRRNGTSRDICERWVKHVTDQACADADRTHWLLFGLRLGSLSEVSLPILESVLSDSAVNDERMSYLIRAGRADYYFRNESRSIAATDCILNAATQFAWRSDRPTAIEALANSVNPRVYQAAVNNPQPMPLSDVLRQSSYFATSSDEAVEYPSFDICQKIRQFVEVTDSAIAQPASTWASEMGPWNEVVERGRSLFGDRWIFYYLANVGAGVRSQRAKCDEFRDLQDDGAPLCSRARYARLRSGASQWWRSQLTKAEAGLKKRFTCLVFLSWAGPSLLNALASELDSILSELPEPEWNHLCEALTAMLFDGGWKPLRAWELRIDALPEGMSARTVACYGIRSDDECAIKLYDKYLGTYAGDDQFALEMCLRCAIATAGEGVESWRQSLPSIARSYQKGGIRDRLFGRRFVQAMKPTKMPVEIARMVIDNADKYPTDIVGVADDVCRQDISDRIVPVGVVAERDGWFAKRD
jgi:hypothetical protein